MPNRSSAMAHSHDNHDVEGFYDYLVEHAVPLNEVGKRKLKAYLRLSTAIRDSLIAPPSLLIEVRQFRGISSRRTSGMRPKSSISQTARETMQLVSSVYPNANVGLTGRRVVLYPSPTPLERKLVGPHLRLVGAPPKIAPRSSIAASQPGQPKTDGNEVERIPFPSGSLRYGSVEKAFWEIGQTQGSPGMST